MYHSTDVEMYLIYIFTFSLTDREKKDREHKKQLLQIAKEHEKARELERVQRYKMPQDIKKGEKGKSLILLKKRNKGS